MTKIIRQIVGTLLAFILVGCSSMNYDRTVAQVDIPRFMGTWYVWAGRTTFLERGAYNAVEKYTWNSAKDRIDVDFTFRKDSFDGTLKSVPQKAWISDQTTHARWQVQPFWPLKFDYLVIALDPSYEWTAIGVPSGSYLWIMGRKPIVSDQLLQSITEQLRSVGYPVENIQKIPQRAEPL